MHRRVQRPVVLGILVFTLTCSVAAGQDDSKTSPEQELVLRVEANELDLNLWYGVTEHPSRKRELMDSQTVRLSVGTLGTTTVVVDAPSFRLNVELRVTME